MTTTYALDSGTLRAVLADFGIDPISISLEAEAENLTYKVVDPRGDTFALRIHRPGYRTQAEIGSECDFVSNLSRFNRAVPQPVPCNSGGWSCSVLVHQEQDVICTVSHWIVGRPLAEILPHMSLTEQGKHFVSLGKAMGALHEFAARWTAPAHFDRPVLDANGLLGNVPILGVVWTHPKLTGSEAEKVTDIRRELHEWIEEQYKDDDSFGVIHADLHPGNVLFHDGSMSVIDFDDMSMGWYLYDLAVTSESLERVGGPSTREAFLEGYASVFTLPSEFSYGLENFTLARLLFLLDWFSSHPDRPGFDVVRDKALGFCDRRG